MPGASPSTVTPKIICERGESSICIRGSSESSVESSSSMRPSSGLALRSLGKLMRKDCARPAIGAATEAATSRRESRMRWVLIALKIITATRKTLPQKNMSSCKGLVSDASGLHSCGTFAFCSAEFRRDQLTEPQVGWVMVSLAIPDHTQHEWRQAKRLGTGDQVEPFAKPLHY